MVPSTAKDRLKMLARSLVHRPHERVERYEAPADLDRNQMLARAKAEGRVIEQLFWEHDGRLAHKWPHYFEIYDRYFEKFRTGFKPGAEKMRPLKFLEIGVSHGGSLQLWRKYFGPEAVLFGIDIDPRCTAVDDRDLSVRIGSQADPAFLQKIVEEMGGVDIVLDDGSHIANHQQVSFDTLMPLLSPGGLYIVEDVQTAYWRNWGGGYRRAGSFIELAKSVIDDMYARYHAAGAKRSFAENEIFATSFFDGIVVFEKAQRPASFHARQGKPSF